MCEPIAESSLCVKLRRVNESEQLVQRDLTDSLRKYPAIFSRRVLAASDSLQYQLNVANLFSPSMNWISRLKNVRAVDETT